MHRFDLVGGAFVKTMKAQGLYASISLGVKKADYDTVDQLVALGLAPDYITIDVAHGHADTVQKMIGYLKQYLPTSFLIAGNVGPPEAVSDLENWGADGTQVGIGPGTVCLPRMKTGFGTGGWQLSALKWCARVATNPIIAVGGNREPGDIGKPLRFGATMVTIGPILAGLDATPRPPAEVGGTSFTDTHDSAPSIT